MRRITLVSLALTLVACAQHKDVAVRAQTVASSVDSLRAELQARFGSAVDTIDFRSGYRLRLVFLDTSGRDPSVRPKEIAYKEDSIRYDRAFDQALWLWTRAAKQRGTDTISVQRIWLAEHHGDPLASTEYYFYPKQLEHPANRPTLDREMLGLK